MFGALSFYNACKSEDVKPIIGCEFYVAKYSRTQRHSSRNSYNHLTLLASNYEGYQNLLYLTSMSFMEGLHMRPRIDYDILERHSKGVLCLSGCLSGKVNELILAGKEDEALQYAADLQDLFGKDKFWVEVQRNGLSIQDTANEGLVRISKKLDAPLVATNDIHFLRHEDCDFQDTLLCQPPGTKVLKRISGGKGGNKAHHQYVDIESLSVGDHVVSWKQNEGSGIISTLGNKIVDIGTRNYSGELIVAKVGEKVSKYTKDHICIANIATINDPYIVYLMSRKDKYRIGITQTKRMSSGNRSGFGPLMRASEQKADKLWILKTCKDHQQALLEEAVISNTYNIPTILFVNPNTRKCPQTLKVESFWDAIETNNLAAERCLKDFGRNLIYPLWERGAHAKKRWSTKPTEIRACNLIDGMLMCVGDTVLSRKSNIRTTGSDSGCWQKVNITTEYYSGKVHSIDVEKSHTYFADGILTHNCVATGSKKDDPNRFRFDTDDVYFKTASQMRHVFRDIPESVRNTLEVAEMVDLTIDQGTAIFPECDSENPDLDLSLQVTKGLQSLYGDEADSQEITDRATEELRVINKMGYSTYFLIVKDFVDAARNKGIAVGPGRGSAAGSIIAYALGITKVDPIKHNLLFERFLSEHRVNLPDIDIDFCKERREEVIDYLRDRYGYDRVANIFTFGRFQSRASFRAAARVHDLPLKEADTLSKKIPADITLDEALKQDKSLNAACSNGTALTSTKSAKKLEGFISHAGVHASGIIISDGSLYERVPVGRSDKGAIATQWSGEDCEKLGLVKFDFLGLATLTVIDKCLALIEQRHGSKPDLDKVDLEDSKIYDLFAAGDTEAVFQCFSDGMKRLLIDMKPSTFNDIIAAIALFRPGPLESGIAKDFVERKNGKQEISYIHEDIKDHLDYTYGTMVYQEQVMQIAKVLAGFSMQEADELRKAIGKKKMDLLEPIRKKWLNGCKKVEKISSAEAVSLWDDILKFGRYAFNLSHSACYAYLSYWTAWLKVHYPVEFFAANLSLEAEDGNPKKVVEILKDAQKHNIKIVPPDLRTPSWNFNIESDTSISIGISGIKGIGKDVADRFNTFDLSSYNLIAIGAKSTSATFRKNVLTGLAKAGALDFMGIDRGQIVAGADDVIRRTGDARKRGILKKDGTERSYDFDKHPKWTKAQKLAGEREVYGFYLSGHPMDDHKLAPILAGALPISNVLRATEDSKKSIKVVGVVSSLEVKSVKNGPNKGKKYCRAILEDQRNRIVCMVFTKVYEKIQDKLQAALESAQPVMFGGRVDASNDEPQIITSFISDSKSYSRNKSEIIVPLSQDNIQMFKDLKDVFVRNPGSTKISFSITDKQGKSAILRTGFTIDLSDEIKEAIAELIL